MSEKSKPKSEARFYADSVELNQGGRTPVFMDTEIRSHEMPYPQITRKIIGEVVVVNIVLASIGNTRAMSDAEICAWAMNKINS